MPACRRGVCVCVCVCVLGARVQQNVRNAWAVEAPRHTVHLNAAETRFNQRRQPGERACKKGTNAAACRTMHAIRDKHSVLSVNPLIALTLLSFSLHKPRN
jgi:hypothetical protein